jgi:hypothetical protein
VLRDALVSDELWEAIEPWLPPECRWGGRPQIPNRAALAWIIYVLRHWAGLTTPHAAPGQREGEAATRGTPTATVIRCHQVQRRSGTVRCPHGRPSPAANLPCYR